MLFNLLVRKLKHLQAIIESSLRCLSFSEEINNFLIWECLLDVLIGEVDYHITVWVSLSANTICKDNFFLAGLVDTLDFTIMAYYLVNDLQIGGSFAMILL